MDFDSKTALIVVDVQNDFADPGGGLYVQDGERVVPLINEMAQRARAGGALVVYTQDWHPASTPHFAKDGGIWPVHCVMHTWGAEFHPDLVVEGPIVRKGSSGEDGYSGFTARDPVTGETTSTGLHEQLSDTGITSVVITGLAGDVCVKETALDAIRLGYETTVVRSATRSVELEEGDERQAFEEMAAAGADVE